MSKTLSVAELFGPVLSYYEDHPEDLAIFIVRGIFRSNKG